MPTLSQLQWIGALVGIVVALITIAKAFPSIYAWLRRWSWGLVIDHFVGVHQMMADVQGMRGEVTTIRDRVEKELGPNGGSSLKDQVTIISARQAAIFDGQMRAAFQADRQGRFMSVNRAFEQLVGYPSRDLLGMRWVTVLHQDDQEPFMVAWQHAIKDGRILRRNCRVVTRTEVVLDVCVDAVPILVGDQAVEWQGYFVDPEPVAS